MSKLPSGRWRGKVWHPAKGYPVGVGIVLGGSSTFATKRERDAAVAEAKKRLGTGQGLKVVTLKAFADRWTTDPLFARTKDSTNIHNAERIRGFVRKHGSLPINAITDEIVGEWLEGGKNQGSIPALRAMFNNAMSAKAGRVAQRNPFAKLGLAKSKGNKEKDPPPETVVWQLIQAARGQAGPSYAAWLQVAAFTGMRPGELDALSWGNVDFEVGRIHVMEQWSAKSKGFTLPKNGRTRDAVLTPPAREALLSLPREGRFCFKQLRGGHWTSSARAYHWKAVKAEVGYRDTPYLATRHFAGWYMVNVLELDSEIVAIALGHEDGGELVRSLYGHRDRAAALGKVQRAYESVGNVKSLRVVEDAS